eukprot:1158825-Pelagomonas_calceolata.AAC.10
MAPRPAGDGSRSSIWRACRLFSMSCLQMRPTMARLLKTFWAARVVHAPIWTGQACQFLAK